MHTQIDQRAGFAGSVSTMQHGNTHAVRPAVTQACEACPAAGCVVGAYERLRWERNLQTPGDHATNLGSTMLVLLHTAPLVYLP